MRNVKCKIAVAVLVVFAVLAVRSSSALEIVNGSVNNLTATNATLWGNLVSTNATNATLTCYYGSGNGGINPVLWQYSSAYGVAANTGLVSIATTNITPATWYYFRWRADETTNTAWAAAASNFITLSRTATNFPAATGGVYQVVSTNGEWLAPTKEKVIAANGLSSSGSVTTVSSNLSAHIASTNNPHAVTPGQIGAVPTNALTYLSVLRSMTNYIPVSGSSSNWLSYDPVTRTLSGCVTNSGSGGGVGLNTNVSYTYANGTTQTMPNVKIRNIDVSGGSNPVSVVIQGATGVNLIGYATNSTTNIVIITNITYGSWTEVASLPSKRKMLGVGVLSDKLYAAGGGDGGSHYANVYAFNGSAWAEVAGLPGAAMGVGLGTLNNKLYSIGGGNPAGFSASVYEFNGSTWTAVTNLPAGRGCMGIGVLNNILYSVGGESGEISPQTNVYAFNGSTWTEVAGLPAARTCLGVGVLSNKLYAVGGYDGFSRANVYAFDGSTWTEVASLPAAQAELTVSVLSNTLYAVGGGQYYSTSEATNVYAFNGSTWTEVAGLPSARALGGSAVLSNVLYAVAGGPYSGTAHSNVYSYYAGAITTTTTNYNVVTNTTPIYSGNQTTPLQAWKDSNSNSVVSITPTNIEINIPIKFGGETRSNWPSGGTNVTGGDLSSTQTVTRILDFFGTDFSALVGTNNPDDMYQFSWTIATNAGFAGTTISVQSTTAPAAWTYWNGTSVETMQTGYLPHTYLNSYSARVYYTWTNSIRGSTYYCRGYIISSNPPTTVNIVNTILEPK